MTWLTRLFKRKTTPQNVRKVRNVLSARDRQLVLAHAKGEMKKTDIASYYNISLATVYKIIRDAKK